ASGDTDSATLLVKLCPPGERRRSTAEVVDDLRRRLALIPGAEIKVSEYDMMSSMMSGSSPITITLKGDDLDVLRRTGEEIAEIVRRVPGTYNVKTSLEEGKPTAEVRLDRERAAAYGIGTAQVAQALRASIMGEVVTQYRSGGEELDLRLRLIPEARQNLRDLENIRILSPTGVSVPLREIAEIREGVTPAVIRRQDQTRVCTITGDLAGRPLGVVIRDIKARLAGLRLPPGYEITYGGQQKMMQESFSSLGFALVLGILLVYMVMASQFESLLHPFVIMFTIPLALIGVVLAFIITGKTFGVTAFIGVILLAGIVVKNGIVLVDYINTLRRRGLSREEAILQAGPVRLRPVLMTALTAMLGMLPLAIGAGEGGELDSPLAVAVIGGLFVATFLTLIVIPVVYTVLEDLVVRLRKRLASLFPGLAASAAATGKEAADRSQSPDT
ncbi:MAG: efflux RND transporter permease subunit, partial [Thermacetogeniaceae bacterium]